MNYQDKINVTTDFIKAKVENLPQVGLVLGSGLGSLGEEIENPVYINYSEIPNFPISTVEGHASRFVIGKLSGKNVIAMQGRFHYYEGYSMQEVTFPIRVMISLGIKHLILTNAAGGMREEFEGGKLMLITDHINIMGVSPLIGPNLEKFGPRFPDVSNVYCKSTNELVKKIALNQNIDLKEGVYFYFTGPAYETPAEVRLAKMLGGDAVGMSTAPEAIVAAHSGVPVTGISCITNLAAGIQKTPLNHAEVVEVANRVKGDFIRLLKQVVQEL